MVNQALLPVMRADARAGIDARDPYHAVASGWSGEDGSHEHQSYAEGTGPDALSFVCLQSTV